MKIVKNGIDMLQAINGEDIELHIGGWMDSVIFVPDISLNQINNQLVVISDIWSFSINMNTVREVKKIGMDYKVILNTGLEFTFFIM